MLENAQASAFKFVSGKTSMGSLFRYLILFLIITNVIAVLVESEPQFSDVNNPSYSESAHSFFQTFEEISIAIFTFEYVLRLWTARISSAYSFSRIEYFFSFYGIVDLATILPFYVEVGLRASHVKFDGTIFRVFRLFRLLQLEHFVEAFTLLDDVYRGAKDTLAATGLLALVVWVGGACLFYLFERHH